ncbi:MAG: ATP-dependent RNA helicase RhlE [Shewanella sp.]
MAKDTFSNAIQLSFNKESESKPNIDQWLITVDKDKKSALLSHLINENDWQQALIFIETKHGAGKLVSQLEKRGIESECIHSGRTQAIREKILADFKAGNIKYLISTGVSARGIDIDVLPLVINYDLPFPADEYVHRIGRTGRAGASGEAISLVSRDDFKNLCMIERRLGHLITRKAIEGFEPSKEVPISVLNFEPKNKPVRDRDDTQHSSTQGKSERGSSSSRTKPSFENRAKKSDNSSKSADSKKLPPNPWNV